MKHEDVLKLYQEYLLPTYRQTPVCLVRGRGSRVWDLHGREYLDFFPGWAVSGLGHCHPEVVHALKHQARKMLHISNNFLNLEQAKLAREIVRHAFPGKVFFCNSGAEATEAAIKFVRRFGNPTGRFEIITMHYSFHGRTSGAMAATGQERIHQGFDPLLGGFRYAEFNNLDSVKALVTDKTVAIFLEPIQGEGGVVVATQAFMQGIRKLCDEKKILLIVDEVQTGMGRTGKYFGYQHYDLRPDLMTLAKCLGGGVPIGALVVRNEVAGEVFSPGTHGSTYGGNPLVAAAGLAVFRAIQKEQLLKKAVSMGEYLAQKLEALKKKYPVIQEVRGLGLMRAIKLSVPGASVVEAALKRGLIINCTQENVLRILPAMTIEKKRLDQGIGILDQALAETVGKT
ncbi:MAG: aspartate aminotransferase family protein [Candidatus Omnitrophota bacterium]